MGGQIDWGEKFRRLGEDVSGAIRMRRDTAFKRAELTKKADLERKDKLAKEATASSIGEKYGQDAQNFYKSGDFGDYAKMRELDIKAQEQRRKAAGGSGGGEGGSSIDRYLKTIKLAELASQAVNTQLAASQDVVKAAQQSKDPAKIEKAVNQFNVHSDAAEKVNKLLAGIVSDGKEDDPLDMALSQDANKTNLVNSTIKGSIEKGKVLNSKILTSMDNSKSQNNVGYDLSGVPSKSDIDTFKLTSLLSGKLSKKDIEFIDNTKDQKNLAAIANDDEAPEAIRQLAGAKYKRMAAAEVLQIKADQNNKEDEAKAKSLSGMSVSDRIKQRTPSMKFEPKQNEVVSTPISDKMKKKKSGK